MDGESAYAGIPIAVAFSRSSVLGKNSAAKSALGCSDNGNTGVLGEKN